MISVKIRSISFPFHTQGLYTQPNLLLLISIDTAKPYRPDQLLAVNLYLDIFLPIDRFIRNYPDTQSFS
jgi:hypothetical protein